VDAGGGARRLVEEGEGSRKIEVRILRNQAGKPGNRLGYEDRASLGMADFRRVLRIRQKGELPWARVLDAGKTGDLQVAVSFEAAAEGIGDLAEFHGANFQRTARVGRIGPEIILADRRLRNRYRVVISLAKPLRRMTSCFTVNHKEETCFPKEAGRCAGGLPNSGRYCRLLAVRECACGRRVPSFTVGPYASVLIAELWGVNQAWNSSCSIKALVVFPGLRSPAGNHEKRQKRGRESNAVTEKRSIK
jgi:hypothetical protein